MGGVRSCQSIFKSGSFAPKLSLVIVIHDFGTRNGFKSTKRQTPSSSIDRQLRCLPNLVRRMHRGQNLALLSKPGSSLFSSGAWRTKPSFALDAYVARGWGGIVAGDQSTQRVSGASST